MQRVSCTPHEAASIRRVIADYDATAHLREVRCPTLVLHNPHDAMVPFEEGRLVASSIAGAHLVPFESQNHVPLCGEPAFDLMNRLIDEFVLGRGASQVEARAPEAAANVVPLRVVGARRR
jgi:pimeloyl-ACP methyl ester carboxylesterase